MSKLIVASVRDAKAEAFMQPIFTVTRGTAERSFAQALGDKDAPFARTPEDYSMWELGTFDEATGVLAPHPHGPQLMVQAIQLLNKEA